MPKKIFICAPWATYKIIHNSTVSNSKSKLQVTIKRETDKLWYMIESIMPVKMNEPQATCDNIMLSKSKFPDDQTVIILKHSKITQTKR